MGKIKRAISLWFILLLTVLMCLTLFGCNNKTLKQEDDLLPSDEGSAYGLYTNLALSIDGGDGQVWATVKNTFTLFPSAVTVKVELYNSEYYHESYSDMTLVAENYIADLDQSKTITATYSTKGKTSYWKARMYYRIDGDGWKERVTNTILLNQHGIVTNENIEKGDRLYYISDLLRCDAERVCAWIYPYVYVIGDNYQYIIDNAFTWLEQEEHLNVIKELFGEIKLNPFDLDTKTNREKQQFYMSEGKADFDMHLYFNDGSFTSIFINDDAIDILGANLLVQYNYFTEGGNKIYRYFTSSISNEATKALYEFIKNIYES